MKSSDCILSERIERLRERRLDGARVSQLVADLRHDGLELPAVAVYLREAFLLSGQANVAMIPKTEAGEPDPAVLDDFISEQIDANRETWSSAPPYPDLLRRRDRIAFEQTARKHDIVLIVCAANQPAPTGDPAADASAPLACRTRDDFGAGYRLHGAYRRATGVNAWTAAAGASLRAELNRRLGGELVRGGPIDTWQDRLERDDGEPSRGPRPPVLFFLPDGNVVVRDSVEGMERYYRFLGIDWDLLYPGIPAVEEEAN